MIRTLSRKIFSLVLCVLFCISLCPAQVFAEGTTAAAGETAEETPAPEESAAPDEAAAEEPAAEGEAAGEEAAPVSGDCGEGLTWSLDENGVLTVSGTGTMTGWAEEPTPWVDSVESITEVVLEDGVENIGECAFGLCTNLQKVTIPDSVTEIQDFAFYQCSALTGVVLPAGLADIGDFAFAGCTGLQAVTFTGDAPAIGTGVFSDDTASAYYPQGNDTWTEEAMQVENGPEQWASFRKGDVNNDGVVNEDDLALLQSAGEGTAEEGTVSPAAADLNGDGLVTAEDAAMLEENLAAGTADMLTIYFNANGGECDTTSASVPNGTAMETLPEASLENCNFDGWFTAVNDGDQITSETVMSANATLYAHWSVLQYTVNWDDCACAQITVERTASPMAQASCGVLEKGSVVYYSDELQVTYTPAEGYTNFTYGMEYITVDRDITAEDIFATADLAEYTVNWEDCPCAEITVERTASPLAQAACGSLEKGSVVYYSDELQVTYTPVEGFTNYTYGAEAITVDRDITAEDIFATADVMEYTVSWDEAEHTTISVNRTESPLAGAEAGELENGATVYHNDVLEVTYDVEFGYELTHGEENITVTDNIGPETIYATATPKEFTYTVIYQSSHGTDLGTAEVTSFYGETETITAPDVEGYTTPDAQEVTWDAESKEISFIYVPVEVTGGPMEEGMLWNYADGVAGIVCSSEVEIGERTADTVQVRIHWTQRIFGGYFGFRQLFNIGFEGGEATEYEICSSSKWCYDNGDIQYDSVTVSTDWITIPAAATQTSVNYNGKFWAESTQLGGTLDGSITIPTY